MGAPIGNRFWEARSTHGRKKIFATPEIMMDACAQYFIWVDDNPLQEEKAFHSQGEITKTTISKMRAMTIEGLCIFLDVNTQYFNDFEDALDLNTDEGKDFSAVIKKVKEIIKSQKFAGAAADLLNANIIARDLGLVDKKDTKHDLSDPLLSLLKAIDNRDTGLPDDYDG